MEKQILLPSAVLREMDETFRLGRNVLWRALTYRRNSPKARMLRAAALQRGGVIFTGARKPTGFMPDVDTRYDHSANMVYQKFNDRMEVEIDRNTNTAIVMLDGEQIATFEKFTTGDWGNLLYSLQQIYNELIA